MIRTPARVLSRLLFVITGALTACSRTEIGSLPVAGGSPTTTGCQTDADCPAGETCDAATQACAPLPGGCESDADCAAPTPHCRLDTHTWVVAKVQERWPK